VTLAARVDDNKVFPLSAAQERLWYTQALNRNSDQYNVPVALDIHGCLNVSALAHAFARVLARHDNMRAVFTEKNNKPIQDIQPASALRGWMRIVDLSHPGLDKDSTVARVRGLEAATAFRLDMAPLLRVSLLRLEAQRWVLLVSSHHIVSDGASLRILLSEVASAYERYSQGEADGLPPLQRQYSDYIQWESRFLSSPEAARSAQFWRDYLEGAPANLGLPSDYRAGAETRYSGRECVHRLSEELCGNIRLQARAAQCSEFMLMLAGLAALVQRYTGNPDLVIATPMEGRHLPEWSELIGFFVNMLPMRIGVRGEMSFRELTQATRSSALRVLEHARYPFINILKDSKLARTRETPYCDIVFQKIDGARASVPSGSRLQWNDVSVPGSTAKFNMLLNAVDDGRSIALICEYNGLLYRQERIESFLRHFANLLGAVLAEPAKQLSRHRILDDAEQKQIVNVWNRTSAPFPRTDVCSLIEAQARATPERTAIVDGTFHVSYAGLIARVAAVAESIAAAAPGGEFVGIMLDRSIRFVIAALAINKTGRAYVPIDPALPGGRIAYVLRDAGVTTVLTCKELEAKVPGESGAAPLLCVEPDDLRSPRLRTGNAAATNGRNAYCLYTSGSTGAPKGVVVSQAALCNYLWWARIRYELSTSVMALHSSLSADLTVTSMLGPLICGGTVRVYGEVAGGNLLESIVAENRVDVLKATPTHLAQLDLSGPPASRLQKLIVGGERLSPSLAARTRDRLNPALRIYNEYGPTEATVGCVVHEYRGDEQYGDSVAIGRPLANMEVYLLDQHLNPVPRGVKGEIYIAGVGLANGYRGAPALTGEKFLPNPFRRQQRMYRTGDIGVLHFNGEMEFSHRSDRQIKVRGYRVELEEIEAALEEHAEISSCIVEVRSVSPAPQRSRSVRYCAKSGLASDAPGAELDGNNVSSIARRFETYRNKAEAFFKSREEFKRVVDEHVAARKGPYDCIVLTSGGKDSMYVLHQVVRMGYKVLAFTLDNGYLSQRALTNIKIAVEALHVDWEVVSPPQMKAIFVDSLRRYSNVCNGCFKAIFTSSFHVARAKGVPLIVSGLSRGQMFETRLAPNFEAGCFEVDEIEKNILEARVAYHQVKDAVSRYMDVSIFNDRRILEDIPVIDFYRYFDVTEKEIYAFLQHETDWIVPEDTGRSTNCLINDVGIHVHKLTRGYHNYALPYAYDVLLGHKEREPTVRELSHPIDLNEVREIIREIGFEEDYRKLGEGAERIVAYYVASRELSPSELRGFLTRTLPEYMLPGAFVHLQELPLTGSGKLDRTRLPAVDRTRPQLQVQYVPPRNAIEEQLAAIWSRLLYVDEVGVEDDFFELGGHSLLAFELIRKIGEVFGAELDLEAVVRAANISALARRVESAKRTDAGYGLPQILPDMINRHEPFPLTDTQEAYWAGRKAAFEMGNVAIHGYLEVTSRNLDIHRLEQAWAKLVARHGMLRAIIGDDATQRILPEAHCAAFPVIDLRGAPPGCFDAVITRIRAGMSHEIRPLDRWPLFDFRIVLKSDDEACLLMSLEVMNVDESSFLILSDELGQLYRQPDAVIAPLELSFRDYVLGQRDLVSAAMKEKSWQYWSQILDELPPGPELPTAVSLKEVGSPEFRRRTFRLGPQEWGGLQKLARAIRITPSGLLLAAYAEILARWSNSRRFTLSIPVYNRLPLHANVNDLVGVFTAINLLVVDGQPESGFVQRAVQMQQRLWRDLDHRYISGITLLRELGRRRGANSEATFPYVFTNIMGLGRSGKTSGLESIGSITYGISQTPQVLLDCQLAEEAGGLYAGWDSVDQAFPAGMLDDMFAAFERVVRALSAGAEDLDARLELAILPEQHRLARDAINNTGTVVRETTVPAEFLARAELSGTQAALLTRQHQISYEELAGMALRIAGHLIEHGARADELIAVSLEKGWRQTVAVFGVLLSGAAYLPVDPGLPPDRIAQYLQHGRVRVVLTESRLEQMLGTEPSARRAAPGRCAPGDLCYMLYTSGSTGTPKGVMIEQRSVTNRMADVAKRFRLGPVDKAIAITSLQHDLSVFDLFGLLLSGGALVIPDHERALDPAHWAELIVQHGVTVWNSVPAFVDILLGYLESRPAPLELSSLRLMLLSGDRIPPKLYSRIRERIPTATVVSLGGPTEITVWDICYPLHGLDPGSKRIPYGFPLENSSCYVLDDELRDCPTWVTGDLYSSGVGLARGYWGDEALTQATFIIHPRNGARMYRTGDLGRYLPDGSIDIVGRRDFQVKVNGYRVECEEIEALLNKHPRVARATVTTFQHAEGGQSLVAYVVADAAGDGSEKQLQRLQFRLSQPGIRRFDQQHERAQMRGREQSGDAEVRLFLARRSMRRFRRRPIESVDLADLLGCVGQIRIDGTPFPKYRYGSAGNLYPVQTYLHVRTGSVTGLEGGLYYYHPIERSLVMLARLDSLAADCVGPENRQLLETAAFVIFLIADLEAIRPLYGEASLRYCAIEAGLMAQLLETSCAGTSIGLTQIGGIEIEGLEEPLQLGGSHELMHALIGGSVDRTGDTLEAYTRDLADAAPGTASQSTGLAMELQRYLQSKLSRAVVPQRFIELRSLPLTANGKVDRSALPAPDTVVRTAASYQAPQNTLETDLARIWQNVLGVDRVGARDNFFDLGGNSVLLIKANQQIVEKIRVEVSITEMFYYPTVEALAEFLQTKGRPRDGQPGTQEESARLKRRKDRRSH
jgi:amino acid adenylation domain-containing protein